MQWWCQSLNFSHFLFSAPNFDDRRGPCRQCAQMARTRMIFSAGQPLRLTTLDFTGQL